MFFKKYGFECLLLNTHAAITAEDRKNTIINYTSMREYTVVVNIPHL